MKILEIGRYKEGYNAEGVAPFVLEQGRAIAAQGCEVVYYPLRGNYISAIHKIRTKIITETPDVIHGHFGLTGVSVLVAVKLVSKTKRPVSVITFHNGEILKKWVNAVSSFFSMQADYVIYVAQHIRDLCYFKAKKYVIKPCGVNIADFPLIDKDEARKRLQLKPNIQYLLFGGAFANKRKNADLLFRAKAGLSHYEPIEVVEMKGMSREKCALWMNACDVFVLPTMSEGSPQALKEAMACNCPIVATDVADIAYLLGDLDGHYLLRNPTGRKDLWMEDANSVSELQGLLEKALYFHKRTNGRERIMELGLDNSQVANEIINIYKHLINNKQQ